jgi:hypothetical protein
LRPKRAESNLGESQKYVDLMYFGDQKSALKNTTMPRDGSIEYGTDFVRIYKDVQKYWERIILKSRLYKDTSFQNFWKKQLFFFSNTLNLKDDEIKLFSLFFWNDSKSRTLMSLVLNSAYGFLITKIRNTKK